MYRCILNVIIFISYGMLSYSYVNVDATISRFQHSKNALHYLNSPNLYSHTMALGSDLAPNRNDHKESPWERCGAMSMADNLN
jgi:hypothetical protein